MGREHDAAAIRAAAHELTGAAGDFDALIDRVGDAGCVLLGESTHGTAEFYAVRAHITQRLVEEKGFGAVAVEADWPAARRADRWARGTSEDPDAATALAGFARFPRWTWRSHEVVAFLQWLREHNAERRADVGFHGLDLYSRPASCDGLDAPFFAEQRARLIRNAEHYHRVKDRVGPEAWNLRERHMAETLDAIRAHVGQDGSPGKDRPRHDERARANRSRGRSARRAPRAAAADPPDRRLSAHRREAYAVRRRSVVAPSASASTMQPVTTPTSSHRRPPTSSAAIFASPS